LGAFRIVEEQERATADAGALWFHETKDKLRGDCCVHRAAAPAQYLTRGFRRIAVGRSHHVPVGVDQFMRTTPGRILRLRRLRERGGCEGEKCEICAREQVDKLSHTGTLPRIAGLPNCARRHIFAKKFALIWQRGWFAFAGGEN
jgi:hypothetical protein